MILAESDLSTTVIVVAVLVAVFGSIGLAVILNFFRSLRATLADELKRELSASQEASPVSVQQPLVVQHHTEFATITALAQVEREAHGRMNRERQEMKERMDKIEGKLDEQTKEINGRIDLIPSRTIELLKNTRQLHA